MSHHNKSWPTAKLLTRPSKSVSKALPQLPHPTLRQTSRCKKKNMETAEACSGRQAVAIFKDLKYSVRMQLYTEHRTSSDKTYLREKTGGNINIIYICYNNLRVCVSVSVSAWPVYMSVCLLLLSRFKALRTKVSRGLRLQYAHPGVELLSLVSACWPQWQKRSMLRAPSVKTLRARTAYHSDHSVVSQPFNLRALLGANRNHDLTGHNVS